MIGAFQEQLITLDELRARMPDLRARETSLRDQLQSLDSQLTGMCTHSSRGRATVRDAVGMARPDRRAVRLRPAGSARTAVLPNTALPA